MVSQMVHDFISSSNKLKAKADLALTTALGAEAVIRTSAPVTCSSQNGNESTTTEPVECLHVQSQDEQ